MIRKIGMSDEERRQKRKIIMKNWRQKNKEAIREYDKNYRETHREQINILHKDYRERNPDKVRERKKKYKHSHPEIVMASRIRYRDNHREELRKKGRNYQKDHRVERRKIKNEWALNLKKQVISLLGGKCFICGTTDKLELRYIGQRSASEIKNRLYNRSYMQVYRSCRDNPDEAKEKLQVLCNRHARIDIRSNQVLPLQDTSIELILQNSLTNLNIPFKKHKSFKIKDHHHQVDIFIEPNICIEADGEHWHKLPTAIERDDTINKELEKQGYIVLRFWEHAIRNNLEKVMKEIIKHVKTNVTLKKF
jgi:very-short-patch-repair endonuclease